MSTVYQARAEASRELVERSRETRAMGSGDHTVAMKDEASIYANIPFAVAKLEGRVAAEAT